MSKIIIHIGLPKTATTTLQQEFFPAVECGRVKYLGVRQPRFVSRQDPDYIQFYKAVNFGEEIEKTRENLSALIDDLDILIMSEEMILVSEPGAPWWYKIANLSLLIGGLDYTIMLTVREPVRALFSYYVEILPVILRESRKLKDDVGFLQRAMSDSRFKIYHYKSLFEVMLQHFDENRIFIKKFEDIARGRVEDLYGLFKCDNKGAVEKFSKNNSRCENEQTIYTAQKITLGDFVRSLSLEYKLPFGRKIKKISRIADKICFSTVSIKKPGQSDMARLRGLLEDDVRFIQEVYGIQY